MKNIIILMVLALITSCNEDFLEKTPIGTLNENVVANKAGINGLLIGAYSLLDGNGSVSSGSVFLSMHVFASYTSDDSFIGTIPNGLLASMAGHTYNASTYLFNDKWRINYDAVQRCNEVLRMLPKATDLSPQEALQIEAEARFLRGVYHLLNAMMFGNIPYIDESITYNDENYKVSNTESVWPKIEADFKFSSDNLTETKADVGRANKWAAKSFLVKTLMFQNKHSEAKPILDDIISNGVTSNGLNYDLAAHYFDNFSTTTKHGPEAVFAVQMSVFDGANGQNGNTLASALGPYGSPATTGYGWTQPTFDLADAYQTDSETGLPLIGDYRDTPIKTDQGISSSEPFDPYSGTLDSRLDWTLGRRGIPFLDWGVNPGQAWIRSQPVGGPYSAIKSIAWQSRADTDKDRRFTNNPYNLIRFADVLLWGAEVEVEIGSLSKAEELVNKVRKRAANPGGWVKIYIDNDDPLKGFSEEPAANYKVGLYTGEFTQKGQDFARKAVRMERRLELALEYHRYFDLQRWDNGTGYMANTINGAIDYHKSVKGYDMSYIADGKFIKGKNEIFPIPQVQIDLSVQDEEATLIQNPGY